MEAKKALAEFKQKVDPVLDGFFEQIIKENSDVDKNITAAIEYARKITMSGGKRARAAFVYYGYLAAGGKEKRKIIQASISIELIHSFLLMHDDIIDKDSLRHGVKTTHIHYSELAKKHFKNKDWEHFGNSMAIIIGDMLNSLGNRALFESKFSADLIVKALHRTQCIVSSTIIGETEDVMIENIGSATEAEIMQMYENKTAKYTIEGPLHLGAILAGADQKFLRVLSAYAIPAGIAFQIQDDILGVFGSISKIGKSVGSDVRQGKQTILVAKAFEKSDKTQKEVLQKCLGNDKLTKKELEDFKKIIIETGSLAYAQNLAEKLIITAKKKLDGVTIEKEAKIFLLGIADYMLNREV